jgi:malonyl-CoA O-methyltransferase
MSSILRMLSNRSAAIAQSFGARAETYDEHADLQRGVARRLARLLPPLDTPRVLELGCGTGLFSRHLLARYPDGTFLFTDLAPSMVEQCRMNLAGAGGKRVSFDVMDAARPTADGPFDLIAMSMTLHWLADPLAALPRLAQPKWRADLRHDQRQELPGMARCARRAKPAHRRPRHPRASRHRR